MHKLFCSRFEFLLFCIRELRILFMITTKCWISIIFSLRFALASFIKWDPYPFQIFPKCKTVLKRFPFGSEYHNFQLALRARIIWLGILHPLYKSLYKEFLLFPFLRTLVGRPGTIVTRFSKFDLSTLL